ncbi:MAG: AMP-binding protein [Staphylococcus sp.]|nr:AMP-binding protein [Staphylococcus sp.]
MELRLTRDAEEFIRQWENSDDHIIAYTSGSTGTPKEIRLLKSDMRASARATISFFNLTADSHLYLPLSPSYIAGKMQIVRALEAGCSLTVEPPGNHPLHTWHPSGRISLLPVVPSQVDGLLESGKAGMIDAIIVGGAPLSPESESLITASGLTAYATYGMTETCSHVALRKLGDPTFSALPGITFDLDERGCLIINSTTLSFRRLVTNDLAALADDSHFRWTGRYDNVINSGGLKISPEQIEERIAPLMPPGSLFYVTSRPSTRWGEEAVLVTDASVLPTNLLDSIRELTGHEKAPKAIVTVDRIELTSSQKIIRRKILG